jgi:hypothetical protein
MPPKKKTKTMLTWKEQLHNLAARDPVLVIDHDDPPFLDISCSSLFSDMIHPLTPSAFLETMFRRKALHVASSSPTRIHPIVEAMGNLDPATTLRDTCSDHLFVWILDTQHRKIQSIEIDSVDTAIALHSSGHATYCRASPQVEQPMVASLLRGTGMGCGNYDPSGESSVVMGRGEVEVFMGTCKHITDWHYDFQENFTLQLSGVKKWTLQQGTVKYPLRGCTPHYKAHDVVESQLKAAHLGDAKFQFGTPQEGINALGSVEEILMKPGDMLYFPAGMWHKVETIEPGVSINVSLMATNYAVLACQALQHYLLTKDEWRETVVSGPTSTSANALEHMQTLLRELPTVIENMTKMNFAEQILPPVVRHPLALELVTDEDDGAEEKDDEVADDEEEIVQDEVADNEADDEEAVVDVNSFVVPENWSPSLDGNGQLIVNKLASLVRMSDVTSFYSGEDNAKNTSSLYVLNINYGGNEMHESTVRVVLEDSQGNLEPLVDGQPVGMVYCEFEADNDLACWQKCLLYYGFFVWNQMSPMLSQMSSHPPR